jgi:hypothetical protein
MTEIAEKTQVFHVLPVDDWKEHAEDATCECNPEVELHENGNTTIKHNAFDGREHLEADHKWRECPICVADLETTEKGW